MLTENLARQGAKICNQRDMWRIVNIDPNSLDGSPKGSL